MKGLRESQRQLGSPFRPRSDISVVSVAFMNGERLQRRPSSRADRRIQAQLGGLPEVFTSRIRPKLGAFNHCGLSVSQPTSPTSSPIVTPRLQEKASPSANSPPSLLPLHLLFPREVQMSARKHCVKQRGNSHFSISGIPFARKISQFHETSYSRSSSMQSVDPALEGNCAQPEVSKPHLRSSFPRSVFGGLSGRMRRDKLNSKS